MTTHEILTVIVLIIFSIGIVALGVLGLSNLKAVYLKRAWPGVLLAQITIVSIATFFAFHELSIMNINHDFGLVVIALYGWYILAGLIIQPVLIKHFRNRPIE